MASRHLSRSIVLQSIYEWDFYEKKEKDLDLILKRNIEKFGPDLENLDFINKLVQGILKNLSKIDKLIGVSAPERPIEQISIIDRNILRIGLFELLYAKKEEVPPKVAINEAIELAKNFGGENSSKFINGVLGTVFKEILGRKGKEDASNGRVIEETLAAAFVFQKKDGVYQMVLILDIFGYWTFPKGHKENEEEIEETIKREITEETGLKEVKIIKKLGERSYIAKDPEKGRIKRNVTDFLVEAFGNTELKIEKSPGIKDGKWFNIDEVLELKRYPDAEESFQKAISYLGENKI